LDVSELETQPGAVRVAARLADNLAHERHPAGVAGELTRAERRRATPGDRRVEQKDGENARDRKRDDQPHRAALAGHGSKFSGGFPALAPLVAGRGGAAPRNAIAVVVTERARRVLGQGVAVALSVGS